MMMLIIILLWDKLSYWQACSAWNILLLLFFCLVLSLIWALSTLLCVVIWIMGQPLQVTRLLSAVSFESLAIKITMIENQLMVTSQLMFLYSTYVEQTPRRQQVCSNYRFFSVCSCFLFNHNFRVNISHCTVTLNSPVFICPCFILFSI